MHDDFRIVCNGNGKEAPEEDACRYGTKGEGWGEGEYSVAWGPCAPQIGRPPAEKLGDDICILQFIGYFVTGGRQGFGDCLASVLEFGLSVVCFGLHG